MLRLKKIKLTGLLSVPVIFLIAVISLKWPEALIHYGYLAILPTVLSFLSFVLPIGHLKLGESSTSRFLWLAKIVLLEVVLITLFIGALIALMSLGPHFVQKLDWGLILDAKNRYTWLSVSFFPWGCLLIWVICLSYYALYREMGPYPHQTMQEAFKGIFEPKAKAWIETTVHSTNYFFISLIGASSVLLFNYGVQGYFHFKMSHTFITPVTMCVLMAALGALYFLVKKESLRALLRKNVSMWGVTLVIMFVLCMSVLIASKWAEVIVYSPRNPFDFTQLQCNACQKFFDSTTNENRIMGFMWGWWLLCIPLAGSYVVKISKGRTLREVIGGVSLLPMLLIGVGLWNPHAYEWLFRLHDYQPNQTDNQIAMYFGLSGVGLITLFLILRKRFNNQVYYAGMLTDTQGIPDGRNKLSQGSKLTGLSGLGFNLLMGIFGILLFHAIGGWYLIQIQMLILAPFIMHFVYGACLIVAIQFTRIHRWRLARA